MRDRVWVDAVRSVKTMVVNVRSETSAGDFANSRRPAKSMEIHGSSPMTHASCPGGTSNTSPVISWVLAPSSISTPSVPDITYPV